MCGERLGFLMGQHTAGIMDWERSDSYSSMCVFGDRLPLLVLMYLVKWVSKPKNPTSVLVVNVSENRHALPIDGLSSMLL